MTNKTTNEIIYEWVPVNSAEDLPDSLSGVDVTVESSGGDRWIEVDVGWNGREWWDARLDGGVEEDGDRVIAYRPTISPYTPTNGGNDER